jgi:hypothetical protein
MLVLMGLMEVWKFEGLVKMFWFWLRRVEVLGGSVGYEYGMSGVRVVYE